MLPTQMVFPNFARPIQQAFDNLANRQLLGPLAQLVRASRLKSREGRWFNPITALLKDEK